MAFVLRVRRMLRRQAVRRRLAPWTVARIPCRFPPPLGAKEKLLMVGSASEARILLLVINSAVDEYVQRRPQLLQCHVLLRAAAHSFLTRDAYVDCTDVLRVQADCLVGRICQDMSRIKGVISPAARQAIYNAVEASVTIAQTIKDEVLGALRASEG